MRPISEKAAELLFCRYLLQAIGLRKAQLFAPTSWEERLNGYDQNIVGLSKFKEVNLQFKSPDVVEKWNRFSLRIEPAQHRVLQDLYPINSAFYVAHTFPNLRSLNQEQTSPKLVEARDFLKHFICIDAHGLPEDARSIHYVKDPAGNKPSEASFKLSTDGKGKSDGQPIAKGLWFRADQLLSGINSGSVGLDCELDSTKPGQGSKYCSYALAEEPRTNVTLKDTDFGVFIRTNAVLASGADG